MNEAVLTPRLFGPTTLEEYEAQAREIIEREIALNKPVAVFALFSGGNDSTVLTHIARPYLDAAVHINTGIGIEQTRDFVRETCRSWDLDLIEKHPPVPYDEIVMEYGFPGKGKWGHRSAYIRLKERPLDDLRRETKTKWNDRILFLTGVRSSESRQRMGRVVEADRDGAVTWVAPIFAFDSVVMNAYRVEYDVPRNQVADLLHMSGECLCGSMAHPGELEELALWFPEVAARIRALEERVRAAGIARCVWGTGREPRGGRLCEACTAPLFGREAEVAGAER